MQYEGIVYRPPSEARSLILQVTIGCSNNTCTFCNMYKAKRFRIRSMEEIRADIEEARLLYGPAVRRVFLADGDAIILPTEKLVDILTMLKGVFPNLSRVTSYATPRDVLRKTPAELETLRNAGLDMVYTGAESGNDEILEGICKGVTSDEIIEAGRKLKTAGIRNSITLISGLGGKLYLEQHAIDSARLISAICPEYVGFLTLMLEPGTPMKQAVEEGKMQLLSPAEVATEMECFLENIDSPGTVFRANHASNYLMLKGTLNEDIPSMLAQIRTAREQGAFRSEEWRAL